MRKTQRYKIIFIAPSIEINQRPRHHRDNFDRLGLADAGQLTTVFLRPYDVVRHIWVRFRCVNYHILEWYLETFVRAKHRNNQLE